MKERTRKKKVRLDQLSARRRDGVSVEHLQRVLFVVKILRCCSLVVHWIPCLLSISSLKIKEIKSTFCLACGSRRCQRETGLALLPSFRPLRTRSLLFPSFSSPASRNQNSTERGMQQAYSPAGGSIPTREAVSRRLPFELGSFPLPLPRHPSPSHRSSELVPPSRNNGKEGDLGRGRRAVSGVYRYTKSGWWNGRKKGTKEEFWMKKREETSS